jgi:diguanylate cyclase (GGDEF)-like protein
MRDLPLRPVTVLVAGDDDLEDTSRLLRELTSAGYELRWVGSAEEAADAPYAIVSARALSELADLRHDALHDALTGLPNRALFLDRLELSIRRAGRQSEEFCCAVLFLDLDRFKLVNDSLGHLVGDRLLMAVAKRLEAVLRPGDTVARLGGDEFTLLLEDIGDVHGASVVAERLQDSLSAPFEVDGREVHVVASIGIALVSAEQAPEEVVRDADVAMYRAKAQGGARHAVFDQEMHAEVMARLELETGLRHAL